MLTFELNFVLVFVLLFCFQGYEFLLLDDRKVGSSTLNKELNEEKRAPIKVCLGSAQGLREKMKTSDEQYKRLRDTFQNCTHVDGNLEVAFLSGNGYDLRFLGSIEEVSGYVAIHLVYSDVPLVNLRLIRGRKLLEVGDPHQPGGKYHTALLISDTTHPDRRMGARRIQLYKLKEVSRGDIYLKNNYMWCGQGSANFDDLLNESEQKLYNAGTTDARRNEICPEDMCHPDCPRNMYNTSYCWDSTPQGCQELSLVDCAEQCKPMRCFGVEASQCCSRECAGGCSGPQTQNCFACAQKFNGSSCVQRCEPPTVYDPGSYTSVPNERMEFTFGDLCLDQCPLPLFTDREHGLCLSECGHGKYADPKGECRDCPNNLCPKVCEFEHDFLSADNINELVDCTTVKGSIVILQQTFDSLRPEQLMVLQSVRVILHGLLVQGEHPNFTSLLALSNLSEIRGQFAKHKRRQRLTILNSSLETLELRSLQSIVDSGVTIQNNERLCLADSIPWQQELLGWRDGEVNIKRNADHASCRSRGLVCHKECNASRGCWGSSSLDCRVCRHFRANDTGACVATCNARRGHFITETKGRQGDVVRLCHKCHQQCLGGCRGPRSDQCKSRRHQKDGPYCVASCPFSKYSDENGVCSHCHSSCTPGGCSGPSPLLLPHGGCLHCRRVLEEDGRYMCLEQKAPCPSQYYAVRADNFHSPNLSSEMRKRFNDPKMEVCTSCAAECDECHGEGAQQCVRCRDYYWYRSTSVFECLSACNPDQYARNTSLLGGEEIRTCHHCHSECKPQYGCTGGNSTDCVRCKNKVQGTADGRDECVSACAEGLQSVDSRCVPRETVQRVKQEVIGGVAAAVVILLVLIIASIAGLLHRAKSRERTMRLSARMSGIHEEERLKLTSVGGDASQLRLITESELKRGALIGGGTYGTVYKGVWTPEGASTKMPVAMKMLHGGQPEQQLREARALAHVEHMCCVRVLALCLTSQLILVTPLLCLGSLLNYVIKNRDSIGSKPMLNWCKQIAKGMAHLESLGIVHRNLAARNVLVQSPHLVKITDYGLAKLQDVGRNSEGENGGKLPLQWLAFECIMERCFTHKSDVWSYGVTVWEVCSYGAVPYHTVRTRDVPQLLEKGERLPQPAICSIDVYMIMIKCWMRDAQSRPCFTDLVDEFAKMARDPGRYLCIKGDKLMRLPSQGPGQELSLAEVERDTSGESQYYMNLPRSTTDELSSSTLESGLGSSVRFATGYAEPEQRGMTEQERLGAASTLEVDVLYSKWEEPVETHRHPRKKKKRRSNRYSNGPGRGGEGAPRMEEEGEVWQRGSERLDAQGYLEPLMDKIQNSTDRGGGVLLNNPDYFQPIPHSLPRSHDPSHPMRVESPWRRDVSRSVSTSPRHTPVSPLLPEHVQYTPRHYSPHVQYTDVNLASQPTPRHDYVDGSNIAQSRAKAKPEREEGKQCTYAELAFPDYEQTEILEAGKNGSEVAAECSVLCSNNNEDGETRDKQTAGVASNGHANIGPAR